MTATQLVDQLIAANVTSVTIADVAVLALVLKDEKAAAAWKFDAEIDALLGLRTAGGEATT